MKHFIRIVATLSLAIGGTACLGPSTSSSHFLECTSNPDGTQTCTPTPGVPDPGNVPPGTCFDDDADHPEGSDDGSGASDGSSDGSGSGSASDGSHDGSGSDSADDMDGDGVPDSIDCDHGQGGGEHEGTHADGDGSGSDGGGSGSGSDSGSGGSV